MEVICMNIALNYANVSRSKMNQELLRFTGAQIAAAVQQVFDLRPTAIIRDLDLRRPIYRQLAAYGHMGREELGVRWEDTDRTDALRAAVAETNV